MKIKILYILLIAVLGVSCVNESYFGESRKADIVKFTIEGELSNKVDARIDWRDVGTVDIEVPSSFDLDSLKVTNVTLSQLSHVDGVDPMKLINFSKPVELTLVAENQDIHKKWRITVTRKAIEKTQLPFSNFKTWYAARNYLGTLVKIKDKQGYYPGTGSDNSPWNTSIEGNAVSASGLSDFSVLPSPEWDKAEFARLVTLKTTTGALIGAGLAAGGLFTGHFAINYGYVISKETRKMINSGTPFYSKPKSVRFQMRYQAGTQMLDGSLKSYTPGPWKPAQDSCDIQMILHNRLTDRNEWIRVGQAALRTPKMGDFASEAGFVTVELPFIYGAPSPDQLRDKPYLGIGGSVGELYYFNFTSKDGQWLPEKNPVKEVYAADPDNTSVDNLIVMFTCSAYGDGFYGAEGSTLDVRNLELIYE